MMKRTLFRWIVVTLASSTSVVAFAISTPAGPSGSAPSAAPSPSPSSPPTAAELAAAREAFKQGLQFFEAGDYANALSRFEAAERVAPTAQVRYNVGRTLEKLGRLVEALSEYEDAAALAKAKSLDSVEKTANDSATAVRARIPKLTVKVDPLTALVTIDGRVRDASKEMLVDPGSHVIEASAPKRVTVSKKVTLAEKEVATVVLKLSVK